MSDEEYKKEHGQGTEKEGPRLEDVYWTGSPTADDEYDQELLELVRVRQRGSVLRPILMSLVIFFVGTVIYDWRDEWGYFFHSMEPIEMGDIAEYPLMLADDPEWKPPAGHNSYVSVKGIPTRVSRGGEYEFFRLIGGEYYVQRKLDEEELARLEENQLPSRQEMLGLGAGGDRVRYSGQGRLLSFAKDPERFQGLKDHYGKRYNIRFCEDYSPRQQEELVRQQRETIYENWARRFENASDEERERRGLTPAPTEEEVADLLARNPVCVNAYLIQDGQSPREMWWHLLFSGLLAGLILFNIVKLVQWLRAWFRV